MTNWDKRFIELARHISTWSKDRSTQVGAVIVDIDKRVVSIGYNGAPTGFPDNQEHIHERPGKYLYFEHAERNAIYNAARLGVSTIGCTIYITDSREDHLFSCADCARAIIQAGIVRVVFEESSDKNEGWEESCKVALEMFIKCRIKVEYV